MIQSSNAFEHCVNKLNLRMAFGISKREVSPPPGIAGEALLRFNADHLSLKKSLITNLLALHREVKRKPDSASERTHSEIKEITRV